MKVAIVIVNYRVADLAIDCLESLSQEISQLPKTRVVVVDNASGDGSAERIAAAISRQGWQMWASVLTLEHNGGYAAGNNAGLRLLLGADQPPEHLLLLNPDTMVRPDAVRALLEFMHAHPEAAIAGSRLEDPDGAPQRSAYRFHTWLSELETGLRLGIVSRLLDRWVVAPPVRDSAHPTDWVAGASMMVRREVFDAVGLLDEGYFLYFEETDFCLHAKRKGFECWYVPESRVVHLVGQSTGVNNPVIRPKRRPGYWFQSRRRYFVKNHGWAYALLADLMWSVGFALWRARRILQNKPDVDPPHLLRDFLQHAFIVRGGNV